MKKTITFFLTVLLISSQAFAQGKSSVEEKEKYNQSQIDKMRIQNVKRAQAVKKAAGQKMRGQYPVDYNNSFGGDVLFFNQSFGFSTFFNNRVGQDTYLIAEMAFFTTRNNNNINQPIANTNDNNSPFLNRFGRDADIYPLYVGLRRALFIPKIAKRLSPYVSGGLGVAFGLGENFSRRNQGLFDQDFHVAPSFFGAVGTEIFVKNGWFFDTSIRYNHLKFGDYVGQWKDFSGATFLFGFGKIIGGGTSLLR